MTIDEFVKNNISKGPASFRIYWIDGDGEENAETRTTEESAKELYDELVNDYGYEVAEVVDENYEDLDPEEMGWT